MNDAIPFADLIFLAIVAGFIILRLRSILGRKIGHDGSFHYTKDPKSKTGTDRVVKIADVVNERRERNQDQANQDMSQISDPSVVTGLSAIRSADPQFDFRSFTGGAKAAFEMALEAFKKDDRTTLKRLLSDALYQDFIQDLEEQKQSGKRLEVTIVSIQSADITRAELSKNMARVTVQFGSEQIHLTRDAQGEIIEGNPNEIDRVIDEWTFERNVNSSDPNWTIVAT